MRGLLGGGAGLSSAIRLGRGGFKKDICASMAFVIAEMRLTAVKVRSRKLTSISRLVVSRAMINASSAFTFVFPGRSGSE